MDPEAASRHNAGARLIHPGPTSRRSPVHKGQAEFLAILARDLIDEYRLETEMQSEEMGSSDFFALPSYRRFTLGATACGFVCRDLPPDFPIAEMLDRPADRLASLTFPMLRHYVHTLLRAEVWGAPWSSPIRQALEAGALEILHDRLLNDSSLYLEP